MAAREVKIVVKNVYAPAEQQQFIVDVAARVRQLKQLVSARFPGNPPPEHQKLIFGGKVCADSDALLALLSVVRSEERAEDAAAVVFHLLVTSTPPRSRPSTPPAAADSPAATADSPSARSVDDETAQQEPQPAASAAVGEQHAPAPAPAPASAPAPAPQQHTAPDLFAQGMLMHQQAMLLAQIQYLQYLKAHAQHAQPQHHSQTPPPYAHFGYFGMGMHPPQVFHPAGQHHPAAAAAGATFPAIPQPAAGAHTVPAAAAAAAAGELAAPRPVPLAVQIAREILPLFDVRLALKMAFMLFIIGQDTPNDRVLMLALLSFISYLHITGILAKIYEVYKRHYTPSSDANNAAGGAAENQNAANHAAGARANGVAAGLARMDFARVLRISSDRGVLQDIKYFFVGFLLSLVPAWHPQPLQGAAGGAAAAPAAPPVQDMPDVAEMPVQGI